MNSTGLKRVLGLPSVTFIAVGFMIGGGIFVFTGIVLKICGTALPVAYGLAVIPVFISMMPLAMLGSAIPSTGANYKYPCRMVSPLLAFTGIWVYALASFFGQIPLYALGCSRYAGLYFPDISPIAMAIAIVTFFYLINLFGVRLATIIQGILVVILISALLFYAVKGIPLLSPEIISSIPANNAGKTILGTALLTFTYFGANGIIEIGGEIKDPGKVIPRAFLIAFPLVAVIYIIVAFATIGAIPLDQLSGQEEPLITAGRIILNKPGMIFFTLGGAILALTTTLNALFIVGTKSLLMMVEDKILPEIMGKLHKKFHTPYVLLTFIWICSITGIVSGLSLQTLASYAALGGLIIFLPIQISSLRLRSMYPGKYNKAHFKLQGFFFWFCPLAGILMVLFFGAVLLIDLKLPGKILYFLFFIVSGLLCFFARQRYLSAKGISLKDLTCRENWHE